MVLKPFEELNATANEIKKYPESICGDFVNLELGQINLKNE